GALDAGELVEDGPGGGVGQVQAVEGGQGGAGGGDGGSALGQDAGQGDAFTEGGAELGLDQPEDQQGDPDDGDERLDPVVVVQEDRPDPQCLPEVAVALLRDPLVLAGLQDVQGGQRAPSPWSGRLAARAYSPSSGDAAAIAAVSRCQLMTGLPALVPVVTASRSLTGPVRTCATLASTCLRVLQ